MIEKTLIIIKPDAVQRGLIGEVISRLEKCGLKLIAMKMVYADKRMAGEHYADDEAWLQTVGEKTKESYEKRGVKIKETEKEIGYRIRNMLLDYIAMSPSVCLVAEGHNAVKQVRKLVGATSPFDAAPGTIRGDYAHDTYQLADGSNRPIQNLIHASGEVDEAEREIKVWFTEEELHAWERADEALLYRSEENEAPTYPVDKKK